MQPEIATAAFDPAGLSFEEALVELEKIVERLETGTLSLDQSLREYEMGVALSRHCALYLREAEARVELLSRSVSGEDELQPFRLIAPGEGAN